MVGRRRHQLRGLPLRSGPDLTNPLAKKNQIQQLAKDQQDPKGKLKTSEEGPTLVTCASNAHELGQKPTAEALIPLLGVTQS